MSDPNDVGEHRFDYRNPAENDESLSGAEFSRASRQNWHRSAHNYAMPMQIMFGNQHATPFVYENFHGFNQGEPFQSVIPPNN